MLQLKNLSGEQLAVYNLLHPLKQALLSLKTTGNYTRTEILEVEAKIQELAQMNQRKVEDPRNALDDLFDTVNLLLFKLYDAALAQDSSQNIVSEANKLLETYLTLLATQNVLENYTRTCFSPKQVKEEAEKLSKLEIKISKPELEVLKNIAKAKLIYCDCLQRSLMEKITAMAPEYEQLHFELLELQKEMQQDMLNVYCKLMEIKNKEMKMPRRKGFCIVRQVIKYLEDEIKKRDEVEAELEPLVEYLDLLETRIKQRQEIHQLQDAISKIESKKVNGVFMTQEIKGQTQVLSRIDRCKNLIDEMEMENDKDYHHLIAVRKCLMEMQKVGPLEKEELYPFQLKLQSFDDDRSRFEKPKGYVLHALLNECYDIKNNLN